jgi:hypothetical protein
VLYYRSGDIQMLVESAQVKLTTMQNRVFNPMLN